MHEPFDPHVVLMCVPDFRFLFQCTESGDISVSQKYMSNDDFMTNDVDWIKYVMSYCVVTGRCAQYTYLLHHIK